MAAPVIAPETGRAAGTKMFSAVLPIITIPQLAATIHFAKSLGASGMSFSIGITMYPSGVNRIILFLN